jgi:rubrerythrin
MANDAVKILDLGIESEKTGLVSYLGFARNTKDLTGKNMFIRLAMDEFDHMVVLERQKDRLLEGKNWVKAEISRSEIEEIVPRLSQREVRTRGEEGQNELSALHTALELEERGIQFYERQAGAASSPDAKAMFERLAEMERAHFELIQAQIDYITGTGYWFGIREFSPEVEG